MFLLFSLKHVEELYFYWFIAWFQRVVASVQSLTYVDLIYYVNADAFIIVVVIILIQFVADGARTRHSCRPYDLKQLRG